MLRVHPVRGSRCRPGRSNNKRNPEFMNRISRLAKLAAILVACLLLGGCDDVRVYGSVGYSSYGGYGGYGSSVRVGGRIY